MRKNAYILILIFFSYQSYAQQTALVDSLQKALQRTNKDAEKITIYKELSQQFLQVDTTKAIAYAQNGYSISQNTNDEILLAKAAYGLGKAYYYAEKVPKAIEIAENIITTYPNLSDSIAVEFHNLIGLCYFYQQEPQKALNAYQKGLLIAQNLKDKQREYTFINNIGQLHQELSNQTEAKTYFLKGLQLALQNKDSLNIGVSYVNYALLQESDSAVFYLHKALAIFDHLGDWYRVAITKSNIGSQYLKIKDYQKAFHYFNEVENTWLNSDFTDLQMRSLYNTGSVLLYLNKEKEAVERFRKGITIATRKQNAQFVAAFYDYLSLTFDSLQQYDSAYYYKSLQLTLYDSLNEAEKAADVIKSDLRFRNQQQEKELLAQQLELSKKENERNIILVGAAIFISVIVVIMFWWINKNRLKQKQNELELQKEQFEKEKLAELDRAKTKFFTQVAHEFRTPLTLIKSPLIALLEPNNEADKEKYYELILKNAGRLEVLINQLIDLSKIESGKMSVNPISFLLDEWIDEVITPFQHTFADRGIMFDIIKPNEDFLLKTDPDHLQKIVSNLLSNALKFTPQGGVVNLKINFIEKINQQFLQITIADTGLGVAKEELPLLFDYFHQATQSNRQNEGSGVGLALVKELIELQQGEISVQSKPQEGTTFFIQLPCDFENRGFSKKSAFQSEKNEELVFSKYDEAKKYGSIKQIENPFESETSKSKKQILIVEDNEEMRTFLKSLLEKEYQILIAKDGREGLELAKQETPDLILSDVMMPNKDGISLVKEIRSFIQTSHIPIILLTAKANQQSKLTGLSIGAEEYLTKPFDPQELRLRIKNIFDLQQRLHRHFNEKNNIWQDKSLEEIATIPSADKDFLFNIQQIISQNIENESFSVQQLSDEMAFSRSQLHRKLSALTGKNATELIRTMRLQKAHKLLETQKYTASEVTFMVGFSSLSYFSKCFKEEFGISPSEVKKTEKE